MVCERGLQTLGTFRPFGAELLNQKSNPGSTSQQGSYSLVEQGGHEAEVYVSSNRVVWSAGRHVRKRFTAPGSIWQAVWCNLQDESGPVLALLLVDCIIVYSQSGATHTVPLDLEPAAIWPVPYGLLVQLASTQASPLKGLASSSIPRSGSMEWARAPATLLSMLHPLEDLQGVQVDTQPGPSEAFSDPHESVIWSSSTIPYIVTYHAVDQRHSIWKVHPPTRTAPLSSPSWTPPPKAQDTPAHLLPIEAPLVVGLTRFWTQSSTGKRATRVHHAHDADGEILLCLLIKETESLVLLKVSGSSASTVSQLNEAKASGADKAVSVLGVLPAKSAVAVEGTRRRSGSKDGRLLDLLLLARDGSLMLHVGAYALCQLAAPSLTNNSAPPPLTPRSPSDTPEIWTRAASQRGGRSKKPAPSAVTSEPRKTEIVDLKDAVWNRFNLVYADGSVYRTALNVAPESPLVATCLSILALLLPADLHRAFVSRLLETDSEWHAFAGLLQSWVRAVVLATKPAAKQSVKKGQKSSGEIQKPSDNEAQSDWDFLLHSDLYVNAAQDHSFRAFDLPQPFSQKSSTEATTMTSEQFPSSGSRDSDVTSVREAVLALHLAYEDLKLDILQWGYLRPLAALLHSLATTLSLVNYQDYYAREWGFDFLPPPSTSDQEATPLDVYSVLRDMLAQSRTEEAGIHTPGQASGSGSSLPALLSSSSQPCLQRSRQVLALYDMLTSESSLLTSKTSGNNIRTPVLQIPVTLTRGTTRTAAHAVVLGAVGVGITLSNLDRLPSGVALPIRHALYECRDFPPPDWPAAAFVLIGREDLAAARLESVPQNETLSTKNLSPLPYAIHLRPVEPSTIEGLEGLDDDDGMEGARACLRFTKDLRLDEVRYLLNSSQPVAVRISGGAELPDQEQVTQQQALLWQLAQRTTALPAGRGAFTLATADPILTEALPLPKLVLAGRLPAQHNATVNLDVNAGQNLTDLTTWPDFHNGVAAGLRLAPGKTKITRTWITYNTPETPNPSHAGVLMALGLQGHLRVLAATDVYRYLAQEHDVTTVGVLLGMASAHRGTLNPVISKMLYLHIPARHPPSFPELELPPLVQSAALVAVGLLYQGSAHRLTTEILLAEIGRKPGIDAAVDREGYALSAGLALGLVCLGRGNEAVGLADLHIEDRLHHYLAGGSEHTEEARARELAFGLPKVDDFETSGGQILEGDMVNVDVTAPGATLALALMFLKTNNATVAARLKIPDTYFDLEYVRPDFILLRVLARSLIMWDSVAATESWVNAQLPEIVKKRKSEPEKEEDVDTEALAQAHVNITAGACFAIGVRFAGKGNEEARALLHRHVMQLIQQKRGAPAVSTGDSKRVDKGTLETCLNVVALSLSVVMAGTGDLETLRLLRFLRKRMPGEGEVSHGNHMAIGMALGFLFMGGGSRTFATTNEAVAALVVALYPRFPQAPNDHRCHLQAFRHLYVLATEDRCIEAFDVDSNQPVCVPLEITVADSAQKAESAFTRTTPCLLPERAHLKRVRVSGDRYWPHVIDLQSEAATSSTRRTSLPNLPPHPEISDHEREVLGLGVGTFAEGLVAAKAARLLPVTPRRGEETLQSSGSAQELLGDGGSMRTLYVKKKAAAAEDGSGVTSAMTSAESSNWSEVLRDSSADPSIVAFAEQFCSSQPSESGSDDHGFSAFCSEVLQECLASEKPAIIRSYLELYASVHRVVDKLARGDPVSGLDCLAVANLKLALAYCLRFDRAEDTSSPPLLRMAYITPLHKRVEKALEDAHLEGPQLALSAYLASRDPSGQSSSQGPALKAALGLYLIFHGIPSCGQIAHLRKGMANLSTLNLDGSSKVPLLSFLLPDASSPAILRMSSSLEV